jgi:flagellar assembly protein FliH
MPPLPLESFDRARGGTRVSEAEVEAVRREAYENGFQAGATDAVAALHADEARLSAELVARLQDMSFGFHEASAHVIANVVPVLKSIVGTVLPKVMAETVGHTILEAAEPLVAEAAGIPVRVLCAPAEVSAVRAVIGENADVPFVIVEDPSLAPGSATLKLGDAERRVDVAGVLEHITASIDAVMDLNARKTANG